MNHTRGSDRGRRWFLAAVSVVLTVGISGCIGGTTPEGATAVYLNADGQVEVVFAACGHEIGTATLARLDQRDDTAEDPTIGQWRNQGKAGDRTLTIETPDSSWAVEQNPGTLADADVYQVEAGFSDVDNGATSATFTLADLNDLGEEEVVGFDQTTETRSSFEENACS